jgi:hypothetical protein
MGSRAFGPPIKQERVGKAGLSARPAVRTGWKACATGKFQNGENEEVRRGGRNG